MTDCGVEAKKCYLKYLTERINPLDNHSIRGLITKKTLVQSRVNDCDGLPFEHLRPLDLFKPVSTERLYPPVNTNKKGPPDGEPLVLVELAGFEPASRKCLLLVLHA